MNRESSGLSAATIDIAALVDGGSWNASRKQVLFFCSLALIFDGLDNQILGFAIPSLIAEWKVLRSDFAPALALGFVGMAVGSPIGGVVGDRFGRKLALIASVTFFALATMAIAFASSVNEIVLCRFIAGLGLGGAVPAAMALTAEYTPMNRRSVSVIIGIACIPIGGMIGGLVAAQILPTYGWRALFFVSGLVPLFLAIALALLLPESPQYLLRHGAEPKRMAKSIRMLGENIPADSVLIDNRNAEAGSNLLGRLFDIGIRRSTLALWAAFFFCQLPVFMMYGWAPTLLTTSGIGVQGASFGLALFNFGGTAGCFAAAWAISRLGTRAGILGVTGASIVGTIALATIQIAPTNQPILLSLLCIQGFFLLGAQGSLYALATHVYSPSIRSTGVGVAASFGRAGAIASAFAGSGAIGVGGSIFFVSIAVSLLIALIAVASVNLHAPPVTANRPSSIR